MDLDLIMPDDWVGGDDDDRLVARHHENGRHTDTFRMRLGWMGLRWLCDVGEALANPPTMRQRSRAVWLEPPRRLPIEVKRYDRLSRGCLGLLVRTNDTRWEPARQCSPGVHVLAEYGIGCEQTFSGRIERRHVGFFRRAELRRAVAPMVARLDEIIQARHAWDVQHRDELIASLPKVDAKQIRISTVATWFEGHEVHGADGGEG